MTFLANIPVWVFPLFIGLCILGGLSSRDRHTPVAVFYIFPFLGLLSVRTIVGLGVEGYVWAVFALGYIVGMFAGRRVQPRFIVSRSGSRVSLRGEWLTLTMLMGIFTLNFIKGTVSAIAPHIVTSDLFALAFSVLAGGLAGLFLGRSLATITMSDEV